MRIDTRFAFSTTLSISALCATIAASSAAEIKWVGNQSDQTELNGAASFNDGINWFNYVPPGEADTAIFGSSFDPQMNGTLPHYLYFGAYQTSYSPPSPGGGDPLIPAKDAVIDRLEVRSGEWTFDVGTNVIGRGAESGSLTVKELMYVGLPLEPGSSTALPAALTIRSGKLTQSVPGPFSSLTLGDGINSDGRLVVDGPDAEVTLAREAWIGNGGGIGRLEVINGARFSATGIANGAYGGPSNESNTGHIKVAGEGSYIYGLNGLTNGSILITDGANAEAASGAFVFLGINNGDSAEASVTGAGSSWEIAQRLTIGGVYHTDTSGRGALNITNGGSVSSAVVSLANRSLSKGDVLVSGAGSEWRAAFMMLGDDGHGSVVASDRGRIITGSAGAVVGNTSNGMGTVTIQDSAEWDIAGVLTVAAGGQGTLIAKDEGIVRVAANVVIGSVGILDVHDDGIFNIGTGDLPSVGMLRIGPTGTLSGTGTVIGDVLVDGGAVVPGFSPGALHVNGNFHQLPTGILTMEIAGTSPGSEYDQLLVTGNLLLEGTVQIAFINSFVPAIGDRFDLFTAASAQLTGPLTFLNAPPDLRFSSSFTDGVLSVTVVPEPTAWLLLLAGGTFAVGVRRVGRS